LNTSLDNDLSELWENLIWTYLIHFRGLTNIFHQPIYNQDQTFGSIIFHAKLKNQSKGDYYFSLKEHF
jgi:hypothetical protein